MATDYPLRVFNQTVQASKPSGVNTPAVVLCPSFVYITLVAVGSAAATCKVEKTYSTGPQIGAGSAVWVSVHASLDAVGTTPVPYDIGGTVPTAFRVTALTNDTTADLTILGR